MLHMLYNIEFRIFESSLKIYQYELQKVGARNTNNTTLPFYIS